MSQTDRELNVTIRSAEQQRIAQAAFAGHVAATQADTANRRNSFTVGGKVAFQIHKDVTTRGTVIADLGYNSSADAVLYLVRDVLGVERRMSADKLRACK